MLCGARHLIRCALRTFEPTAVVCGAGVPTDAYIQPGARADPAFPHLVSDSPFLQLSQFPSLACQLQPTNDGFINSYNPTPSEWEQHGVNLIRTVESEQRVLYRSRKSLMKGLER